MPPRPGSAPLGEPGQAPASDAGTPAGPASLPRPTASLHLSCVRTLTGLHALEAEWRQLVDAAPEATVFQSWEWVTSWYEHLGQNKDLLIFTARDDRGRLVGAAPCSRSRSGGFRLLHLLGRGNDNTEYVQVVAQSGYTGAVTRAVFDGWDAISPEWDLLVLPNLPSAGPFVPDIRRLASARGYATFAQEHIRMTRPLPEDWDLFYRSLRKSMKDNVNNYVNRLRRTGHQEELVVVEDSAELDAGLETFLDLHRRRAAVELGRAHEDRFATPPRQAFLRTVARRLFERGALWPCFLKVDGQIVASQLCLVHQRRLYLYYSGFDPAWARSGVMMILTRRCIERSIGHGCRELDLLLGLDQEKRRWGAEPGPVTNLTLASPRLRSRAAFEFYRLRQAGAAWRARRKARPETLQPVELPTA